LDDAAAAQEIRRLARERNAVILAHNYQRSEIQDLADFTGDSLGLSRTASKTDAAVIVFCGVHFMAETAKILSPDRLVLMPEERAGCPMADMMSASELGAWRSEHLGLPVVTYVNSTAEVKALSDVCVTSANAVAVVRSLGAERVLFGPDKNLADWVARSLPDVDVIPWDGWCPTHENVTLEMALEARESHPDAVVMAHPECRPAVVDMADAVLSTSQMLAFAAESEAREFVVLTEGGLLHALEKAAPGKAFHQPEPPMICPNMKLTNLEKVRECLLALEPAIEVPEDVRVAALGAVERMVSVG
jgi:quinolinate synthase